MAAEAVEVVDDDDERAAAQRLVERKLPGMRRLDRATASRRLMAMLARKGYGGGLGCSRRQGRARRRTGGRRDADEFLAADEDQDSLLP